MSLFYKPSDGWAADFIPFYWQGTYHLFYLKDYRNPALSGEGTPWFHLSTQDFVTFTDHGEALPRGTVEEQDLYVFTGCVLEKEGLFHIFYTGHNPHLRARGLPEQAIMHATSLDLIHWRKDPANPILFADPDHYEPHDWRDPFVFWNEEAGEYWMLLAARTKEGPDNRRGCTAVMASPDLCSWQLREPLWSPGLYFTHECPDLFRMGDWWYLVYSTFSERMLTHYRMSRSLAGPWLAPDNDAFDGRAFYAAKTAADGDHRYVFGWLPSRVDEADTGGWQWGGNLVVHELLQQEDGALAVAPPLSLLVQFSRPVALQVSRRSRGWRQDGSTVVLDAADHFAWFAIEAAEEPNLVQATIEFAAATRGFGLLLRSDEQLNSYYQLRFEPERRRVVFDRWPRPGDQPFMLERPWQPAADRIVHVKLLLDGSAFVAYVDGAVALCMRGYDHPTGKLGLFVSEGSATFSALGGWIAASHSA